MKRIDPRGRPAASTLNRIVDGVDSSNSVITTLGGGLGGVTIWKHLMQQAGYELSDYAVRCEVPGPVAASMPSINGWHRLKGRAKKIGLTRGMVQDIYAVAYEIKLWHTPGLISDGTDPVWDSYGRVRLSEAAAADYMLSPVGNTLGWIGGWKPTGVINPDTGYEIYESAQWYGITAPTGNRVIHTGTTWTDPVTGVVHEENWESGGYDGGNPCGDPDQIYARFASWANSFGGIDAQGPGWYAVWLDNGLFVDWPHRGYQSNNYHPHAPTGNFIGIHGGGDFTEIGQPAMGSHVCDLKVDISASFSFNELMASIPENGRITDAQLAIKVSGLKHSHGSYADTFLGFDEHGTPQFGDPTGDYQEHTSTQGIIVVGSYVNALQSRDWQVLGSVNVTGGINSNEWQVADVTSLIQGLIDEHGNSKFTHFAFAPAISTEGLNVMHDGAASYLAGIAWRPTYACVPHPRNPTVWKDGFGYGYNSDGDWVLRNWGADVEYISNSSFSNISWDNVEFGQIAMTWRYPDSEYGREAISIHMCPMH